MVVFDLIRQDWYKAVRSSGFYKGIAVRVLLGVFFIYIGGLMLFMGISLNKILEDMPGGTPMELFNGAMLYLLLTGLALRFVMQQLNSVNLTSYQVLPLNRSVLINFLLLKPLVSIANYFMLLVVIPFAVRSVASYYSGGMALRFIVAFELMVWSNSLLASFLKRRFGSGFLSFIVVIASIAVIFVLEYLHIFSLFAISKSLFGFVVMNPVGLFIPVIAVAITFLLNKWFFAQNYYPEKFNVKLQVSSTATTDFSFLNRFGTIGELMALQLKLMLRHKRTRSLLFVSAIFLLYGLMFYTNNHYGNSMIFFCAMFMTGILMFMYGQWTISWDSAHFDSILTKNISTQNYILANYYLMLAFNLICFVLTTPYFLFGTKIIYMHLTAFLFNTGCNIIFLLFFATFNNKRVDLSRSSAMNYQGTTYKSFLIVLPIMLFPMLWVNMISWLASLTVALWSLAAMGLCGLLFRKPLLNLCVKQFNSRKYIIAQGFREVE